MEQENCLLWVKREHMILGEHHLPTKPMKGLNHEAYYPWKDHQEEVAFAKDAARGGQGVQVSSCSWPPRSYSCSFCKREFRSAQALGGHMNVHRRDRALLKQAIAHIDQPRHHPPFDHHGDQKSPSKLMLAQNLSQLRGPRTGVEHLSSTRVSSNYPQSSSKIAPYHDYVNGVRKPIATYDFVQGKIAMGRYLKEDIGGYEGEYLSSKRSKKSGGYVALLPIFDEMKSSNVKGNSFQVPEVLSIMEDLDLELRLGHPPHKAK